MQGGKIDYSEWNAQSTGSITVLKQATNLDGTLRARTRMSLHMIKPYHSVILAFTLTLTGLAAVTVNSITPVWQASATLLVPAAPGASKKRDADSPEYLTTQLAILVSRQLAQDVIAKLGLLQQAAFKSNASPVLALRDGSPVTSDPLQTAIDLYLDRLKAVPSPTRQTIDLRVMSSDPQRAVAIVNAHTEAYLAISARQSVASEETMDFALKWMSERLNMLLTQLESAEQRLEMARQRSAATIQSRATRNAPYTSAEWEVAKTRLAKAEAAYMVVYQGRVEPRKDLDRVPAIMTDESVQARQLAFVEANNRLSDMVEKFGRDDLSTLQAEWDQIAAREAVNAQKLQAAERIYADYKAAREQEAETARTQQNLTKTDIDQSQLVMLQQNVDTRRELYYMFSELLNEAKQTTSIKSAGAQIITPAELPGKPIAPRKFMITFLTLIISLLVSTLAVLLFAARKRNRAIHGMHDIDAGLRVPLLGAIPPMQAVDLAIDQPRSALLGESHAMTAIAAGIAKDSPGKAAKIIYVTSTTDGEGKSTVAGHLALAMAEKETVLLVDADLRNRVHPSVPVAPDYRGLTELLGDQARLKDVIKHYEADDLDRLDAGLGSADPAPLLLSSRVDSMFKVLSLRYDRIIVDGPAVGTAEDSLLLARHANAVVFVTRCDDTAVVQIHDSLERLRHAGIRVTGLVLNRLDRRNTTVDSDAGPDAEKIPALTSVPERKSFFQTTR